MKANLIIVLFYSCSPLRVSKSSCPNNQYKKVYKGAAYSQKDFFRKLDLKCFYLASTIVQWHLVVVEIYIFYFNEKYLYV